MLIDVRQFIARPQVRILGTGRTVLPEAYRYSSQRLIQRILDDKDNPAAVDELHKDFNPEGKLSDREWRAVAEQKFVKTTGIKHRYYFPGTTAELGALAAEACLVNAGVTADQLDAIIVGTNTGTGYPSTATAIKCLIGAPVSALTFDMQEACPVGAVAVQVGWQQVKMWARRVLVIAAERAIDLAAPKNSYKDLNLFGCEAGGMLLGSDEDGWPGDRDDFVFHSFRSDPFNKNDEQIKKTDKGFTQNGPAVHEFVGTVVPAQLAQDFESLGLDPASVDHFFPHQPSGKTLSFLSKTIRRQWPTFRATVHSNVEDHGNTSAACTSWMIDRARREGTVRTGQLCLVTSFGAGLSTASYAFYAR